MTFRLFSAGRAARFLGVTTLIFVAACHGPDAAPPADLSVDAAIHGAADLAYPRDLAVARPADLAVPFDLTGQVWPAPMPPPTSCNMRSAGVTGIQAVLRIDSYGGLQSGKNGVHELAEATVVDIEWVYAKALVDTGNIHLAMNVASPTDSAGLPMEIPLTPGQLIEMEGEYIPAATAGWTNTHGDAAVVHFTHSPCGYVVISGKTYR